MEDERFTEAEAELLVDAWVLSREGKAFRPEDVYFPEAHRLTERGWLERRWYGDDMVFRWTQQAETALDVNGLMQSAKGREN